MSIVDDERGGATNVQMALLWSLIALFIFGAVQIGLYSYSAGVALSAAQDGLRSGRYYQDPSAQRAEEVAGRFLDRNGGNALDDATVTAETTDGGTRIRVRVTGKVPSLIPGVSSFTITREASGPIERLTR